MAGRFLISTEIEFSASHSLRGYRGDCARVHGHNWVVRVHYRFSALDEQGLTIDYRKLRSELDSIIMPRFDHHHLNDIPPFDAVNPTSENIAAEIFKLCREEITVAGGTLCEVELWESPTDMVRYSED